MEHEILKISVIDDSGTDIKIPQKMTTTNKPFKMEDPKAIILYGLPFGLIAEKDDFSYINNLIEQERRSFNYIINKKGDILTMLPPPACALSVRTTSYTRYAAELFGSTLCPPFKHTKDTPHMGSPNTVTISVAYEAADKEGFISPETYTSIKKCCAYIMNKYDFHFGILQGSFSDNEEDAKKEAEIATRKSQVLIRYNDITELAYEYTPQMFTKDEFFFRFKTETEIMRTNWLAKYIDIIEEKDDKGNIKSTKKIKRGYPTIETTIVNIV
jgi:hypothetical protein